MLDDCQKTYQEWIPRLWILQPQYTEEVGCILLPRRVLAFLLHPSISIDAPDFDKTLC